MTRDDSVEEIHPNPAVDDLGEVVLSQVSDYQFGRKGKAAVTKSFEKLGKSGAGYCENEVEISGRPRDTVVRDGETPDQRISRGLHRKCLNGLIEGLKKSGPGVLIFWHVYR